MGFLSDKYLRPSVVVLFQQFVAFFFISGIGWLLDFSLLLALINYAALSIFYANLLSSLAAVTFVYLVSTTAIFQKEDKNQLLFLVVFWFYQLISIFLYSILLKQVVIFLNESTHMFMDRNALAKIFVTPLNLITNFVFMKLLSFFMKDNR